MCSYYTEIQILFVISLALNPKEAKYLLLTLVACCTMKVILPQF